MSQGSRVLPQMNCLLQTFSLTLPAWWIHKDSQSLGLLIRHLSQAIGIFKGKEANSTNLHKASRCTQDFDLTLSSVVWGIFFQSDKSNIYTENETTEYSC